MGVNYYEETKKDKIIGQKPQTYSPVVLFGSSTGLD